MKKIDVMVIDQTTLTLREDAKCGDYIDLSEVTNVDTTSILQAIEKAKDNVYNKKLNELNNQHNHNLAESLKNKEAELALKYSNEISELKQKLLKTESDKDSELNQNKLQHSKEIQDIKSSYEMKIQEYENNINHLKEVKHLEVKIGIDEEVKKIKEQFDKQKEQYEAQLKERDEQLYTLQRQKAALGSKLIGEDLETWCDNEMESYMQNGFLNCTWTKDNKLVANEGDKKGTKADFIFKIYADESKKDNELLESIIFDMKDENPDSVNKQFNKVFYSKLDSDRTKKNCRYAVLVSNLETDNPNINPIYKVREYPNMYVVRPAYMIIFINLIVSLTTRFKEIVLEKEKEKLEIKDKLELIEEFESIKNTYLEKPLAQLTKNIESIKKQNDILKKASNAIEIEIESITRSYLNSINDKISKFDVKMKKLVKE